MHRIRNRNIREINVKKASRLEKDVQSTLRSFGYRERVDEGKDL